MLRKSMGRATASVPHGVHVQGKTAFSAMGNITRNELAHVSLLIWEKRTGGSRYLFADELSRITGARITKKAIDHWMSAGRSVPEWAESAWAQLTGFELRRAA